MKKNEKLERLRNIGMIAGLTILIGVSGFVLVNLTDTKKEVVEESTIPDHNIYLYKQDGTISLFNTKNNKYLSEDNISKVTNIDKIDNYKNPFDLTYNGDKILTTSPYSNEIVILSEKGNTLKEERRLKVNGIVGNFKVVNSKIFIHYLDNKLIEVFDLETGILDKTLTFKENVTALEVDENNLYAGVGNYIEILSLQDLNVNNSTKIHTGASITSILKSNDGFLYVGNTFATDIGNSVLLKIDLKNNNVADILEIEKEYPISMFEKGDSLYILCQGITDDVLDGISIIDKTNFERYNNISTGDTPNAMTYTDDGYIYVSHEDGKVSLINARNNFNIETTFTIHGIKNILVKQQP